MSVENGQDQQETLRQTLQRVVAAKEAESPAEPVADIEPSAAEPSGVVASEDDEAQAPEPEVAEPGGGADAPEPTALEPLQHWSKADQEKFAALDDAAKEFVLDRAKTLETTQLAKHRELDAQGRQYQAVLGALEPFKDQMTRLGVSPDQAVAQIAARWGQLQSAPGEALTELARQYGPSMGKENGRQFAQTILQAVGLSPDDLPFDDHSPELDTPEANAIAELRREIQEMRSERQQDRSLQVETQQQTAQQAIDGFKAATNGDGKPAHPHFEALQPTMAGLLQGGLANGLDDAYAKALALSPDLQPAKPASVRRRTETSIPQSSPTPGKAAEAPPKSMRDHLRRNAEKLHPHLLRQ